ncbi:MAG: anthranilate synthase component II [Alphaproteobacteria bacterium]
MFLLIDNYDSFTYNLYHFLGELGAEITVARNNEISTNEALAIGSSGIILSPGPCTPNEAGICLELATAALANPFPLLGVCLGHQSLGQAAGANVVAAPEQMHGKVSQIDHTGEGLFRNLTGSLAVARYHSLVVDRVPEGFKRTASHQGQIMAMSHNEFPLHGFQFHPESIATPKGKILLANFLHDAESWNSRT